MKNLKALYTKDESITLAERFFKGNGPSGKQLMNNEEWIEQEALLRGVYDTDINCINDCLVSYVLTDDEIANHSDQATMKAVIKLGL